MFEPLRFQCNYFIIKAVQRYMVRTERLAYIIVYITHTSPSLESPCTANASDNCFGFPVKSFLFSFLVLA